MQEKRPNINVDILVQRDGKVLLGLLTEQWTGAERKYGLPGRDILFGETIGETVARNVREEFGCELRSHRVIAVNANYEGGNHYIGVGVIAEIAGDLQHLLKEDWEKWEWFSLDAMPENVFAPAKNLIECFRSGKVCVSE